MKAIICEGYGEPEKVLKLREVEVPTITDNSVLVRVHATTVAGDDWHLVRGLPYLARLATGLRAPRNWVPGLDVAGQVEAVGSAVARFRVGDEVFGWCRGALAEFVTVREDQLVHKPAGIDFDQAAAIPTSGFTALQAVRDSGEVTGGKSVLINGAAGGVGTLAVQIANALGAEVTAVCSARNAAMVRTLGASHVVDYSKEDFTKTNTPYDVIVDMIGNRPIRDCRRSLATKGILVMVGARGGSWFMGTERWLRALVLAPFVSQRLRPLIHSDNQGDLGYLKKLIEDGKLKPVIDRHYTLTEVVDAIQYLEGRHARGKVIINVSGRAAAMEA